MTNFKNNSTCDSEESGSLKIEWMTTEQVAEYFQTTPGHIRNLASNGKIPSYKFGRTNLYNRSDLDDLVLKSKRGGK